MNEDIKRIAIVLIVSLLVGWLSGYLFLCLFAGLAYYVYREYRTLERLLGWMRRKRDADAPADSGILGAIATLYDDLRQHHKKQKRRLASYLRRFKEATQALPDAIVVLGQNDEIEWANSKAGKYLGIKYPQDRGQRLINLYRNPALLAFMKEMRAAQGLNTEKSLARPGPGSNRCANRRSECAV
jgi:two-component system phosphate regulon sensor histidine kinase PhoR